MAANPGGEQAYPPKTSYRDAAKARTPLPGWPHQRMYQRCPFRTPNTDHKCNEVGCLHSTKTSPIVQIDEDDVNESIANLESKGLICRFLGVRPQLIAIQDWAAKNWNYADQVLQMELQNFQKLNDNLEKLNRHMIGEEIDSLSTRDLHNHEKKLEKGLRRIRARKEKLLKETLKSLRKEKQPCTCTDHNEVDTSRLCEVQPYEDENERAQDHDSTQFMPQI